MRINIKPLSVNEVFKGKRFRTSSYDTYEFLVKRLLPKIEIPKGQLSITYTVGYSTKNADIDNFVKPFQDILSKHYGFNDNLIYHIQIYKVIVEKGKEFIDFAIENLNSTVSV